MVEDEVLELLAHAPASFAALYGFLVRNELAQADVGAVRAALESMEQRGLARGLRMKEDGATEEPTAAWGAEALAEYRAWLSPMGSSVPVDAVSLDEVGLWFELTGAGRERIFASPGQGQSDWSLEVDEKADTITICGKDEAVIDRCLKEWLERSPGFEPATRSEPEPVQRFTLRTGVVVEPGFRVVVHGRRGTKATGQ
jgi:hypothetical protein